jgi:hypothetical protein
MISFLAKTWFVWWMLAVVFILRWFHVLSAHPESDVLDSPGDDQGKPNFISGQIVSRA